MRTNSTPSLCKRENKETGIESRLLWEKAAGLVPGGRRVWMDFQLTDEQRMLKETAHRLAEKVFRPLASRWDENSEPPLPNLTVLAENGFTGITISEEYGGAAGTILDAALAMEEIARVCPVTAGMILGNCANSEIIMLFGTEEQKRKYLPPIAKGEKLIAWGMTEPDAGSAATELKTRAVLSNDHYILKGNKIFITRASVAKLFIIFTRIGDVPGAKGICSFILDRDTPGFTVGKAEKTMGFKGAGSCELILEDCHVPKDNLLTPPGTFGKVMRGLNIARVLNPTFCLGIAQGAFELAKEYSQTRRQFGKELCEFQGIQWMLADMAVKVDAMRLLIYRAAVTVGAGMPEGPLHAAIAKTYANEAAFDVANAALQIHGGYGYSRDFPLERMVRDVRAFQIAGGSTQILRNLIASLILKRKFSQRD
jgi:alkylation response protein AidB-like acyl-CoA dehydrogenase